MDRSSSSRNKTRETNQFHEGKNFITCFWLVNQTLRNLIGSNTAAHIVTWGKEATVIPTGDILVGVDGGAIRHRGIQMLNELLKTGEEDGIFNPNLSLPTLRVCQEVAMGSFSSRRSGMVALSAHDDCIARARGSKARSIIS